MALLQADTAGGFGKPSEQGLRIILTGLSHLRTNSRQSFPASIFLRLQIMSVSLQTGVSAAERLQVGFVLSSCRLSFSGFFFSFHSSEPSFLGFSFSFC